MTTSSSTAASPFTIREVTGDKRKIQLIGRALPYRPFELETGQRLSVTKPPGFADKTVAPLGAEDDPNGISISGFWKDKYLDTIGEFAAESGQAANETNFAPFTLDNQAITNVKDATDLMDSVVRCGQEVEITWLHTIRRALLKAFKKGWHNEHDVEWTMVFEVIGRGQMPGTPVFITGVSLADSTNALRHAAQKFNDVAVPTNFAVKPDLMAGIGALGRGVEDGLYAMENTVDNVMNTISLPVRAAKALDGIYQNIENEVGFTESYVMGRLAMDFHAENPGPAQSFAQRTEVAIWQRLFYSSAHELRRVAAEQRTQIKRQNESDIMGTYTAREGDDLRDVAALYYNNEWEWRRIMAFNRLSSSELRAGQAVRVPRINPQNPDEA